MFLSPPDDADTVYEFFSPFVHVPGRYEWCRVRSPTHGVFALFIVLGENTAVPATVYTADAAGMAFMRERYPECTALRADVLSLSESGGGYTVSGRMAVDKGPVREAHMTFRADPDALPRQEPYGGTGGPVWGSRFTCWGVDLTLPARVEGRVLTTEGPRSVSGTEAVLTLGSFGRIAPR